MEEKQIAHKSFSDLHDFEVIFKEYFNPLTYYASKFTGDLDSAREIVQVIFVNFWEKRNDINLEIPVRSYLYTSVHNRCINYLRDKSKFLSEDAGDIEYLKELSENEFDIIEQEESQSMIYEAINSLPVRCRQVFKLSRFEEKKYNEIASILGISIKTVEGQMSKALKLLRKKLMD